MKRLGVGIALGGMLFGLLLMAAPATVFATPAPSGTINYFDVSGGSCTSTAWTGPTLSDGHVPGFLTNNVGGPPMTAVVGTGSICIQVVLTGVTSGTFTVTSNKLTGSLTLNSGNGYSAEGVFTSSYSGACTTVPIKISPSGTVGSTSGQLNHVFVGTGGSCAYVPPSSSLSTELSSSTVPIGTPVTDTATLVLSDDGSPYGTITFNVYAGTCGSYSTSPLFTSGPTSVTGSGTTYYTTASFSTTGLTAGDYVWIVTYSGNADPGYPSAQTCEPMSLIVGPPSTVPEFPFGFVLLLALAIPTLFLVRSKYSGLTAQ